MKFTKTPLLISILLGLALAINAQTVLTGYIGEYNLTTPGTYIIKDTVKGNINVELQSEGNIIIEGFDSNAYYEGIPRPGEKRAVGHIKGNIPPSSSITICNITLAHNVHHIIDFGGDGRKHVYNVEFIGQERSIDGKSVFGVAPGNMGGNGLLENCICRAGDDAHQVSVPGSNYKNNHIIMYDNGSAFQFGWNSRFNGREHHADSIVVTGRIAPNISKRTNDGDNPGRCVIGGVFNNKGGDIRLTHLDIDIPQYNNLIKLVVGNVKIDDIYIQGILRQPVYNAGGPGNLKAVAISTKSGGMVDNMVVDLGDEVANPANHFIKGHVNVKFMKSDGSCVEYIDGVLQTSTTLSATETPQIRAFPVPFANEVNMQSSLPLDKIGVFNTAGKQVDVSVSASDGVTTLHFDSTLPKGCYFVHLQTESQTYVYKIIKN